MSANVNIGGLIGGTSLNLSGVWGIAERGVTYLPFVDPGDYIDAVLEDSPVGFWMLDELSGTVADDRVGSYDLTYRNSPNLNQSGPSITIPRAVGFDGSNDVADGANSTTYTGTSAGNWSMELWLKYSSTATSLTPYMVRNTEGASASVTGAIIVNNTTVGVISCQAFNAAGTAFIQLNSGSGFNDNNWHHVVATSTSGGALRLYVDNVEVASSTAARNTTSSQRAITVGANRTGVSTWIQFFPGNLAAVAYYSIALSAGQIQDHYFAGRT